jgi:4,5-DOPA dioxygenase extradiol
VHNLRSIDWGKPQGGFAWAHRFDEAARELLTTSPGDVLRLQGHPDFHHAVPTPDHFVPLVYIASLAAAAGCSADVLIEGYTMGSLSMTAYSLDAECRHSETDAGPAPPLPSSEVVPPDEANV